MKIGGLSNECCPALEKASSFCTELQLLLIVVQKNRFRKVLNTK